MKYLLPLALLLAAPDVGAATKESAQQMLRMDRPLTAQVVGALQPQSTQTTDVLVFDSYTGASAYLTTNSSPRTFMGMPVDLGAAAGSSPMISKIGVYLAYSGVAPQEYSRLRVSVQLWNSWSGNANPVFSNPLDSTVIADAVGPITLYPSTFIPIQISLLSPIPLASLSAHGVVINFQGNTGSGLQSSDNLTPLLRSGAVPVAVGANAVADSFGYRNVSGRTDFNFADTDIIGFGQPNQALVLQLYAALISQDILFFAAVPENPVLGDGTFTVSAIGGDSGNPVVFSIDPVSAGVCAAGGTNGETISILAAGTCTVLADQAGNTTYAAAPQGSLEVDIASGLVRDGGFEAGYVPTYWAQTSTNFETPLCNANCGGAGPRTGDNWAWFGGAVDEFAIAEAAALEQRGLITAGPKFLKFYVWWSSSIVAPPDPAAFFHVKMDGDTIFTLTPATAAAYNAGYTLATVNISAYADDKVHFLRFEANTAATAVSTDINLDDVSIVDDRLFGNSFEN